MNLKTKQLRTLTLVKLDAFALHSQRALKTCSLVQMFSVAASPRPLKLHKTDKKLIKETP